MSQADAGAHLAQAAEYLIGTRFRLHGRHCETGVDCVGVLALSLSAIGKTAPLPITYRLRSRTLPDLAALAKDCGLLPVSSAFNAGDVVLARTGPCQFHVLIATMGDLFVHAHAGVGRVVSTPLPPEWQIVGHWRLAETN